MTMAYFVTWRKKPYPLPFLIDFDDETLATKCAVALSEIGRFDVKVTASEYDEDPELKERIWQRVRQRLEGMPADMRVPA